MYGVFYSNKANGFQTGFHVTYKGSVTWAPIGVSAGSQEHKKITAEMMKNTLLTDNNTVTSTIDYYSHEFIFD